MRENVFITSDTHFSHNNMLKFTREDGSRLRPWNSLEEMDEALIENWNKVVRPNDKVYHLGDVVMKHKALQIVERLHGRKTLIMGNHDIFDSEKYLKYFKVLRACRVLDKFIMTHVPIHTSQLGRFKAIVHGHLHSHSIDDPRYFNACVDFPGNAYYPSNNFIPIPIEEVIWRMKDAGVYS